jgi:hypothetical protein
MTMSQASRNKIRRRAELPRMELALLLRRLRMMVSAVPADWYALPLRLVVGFGFVQHGCAKLLRGADGFVGILHAIGVPFSHLLGWATIIVEIAGVWKSSLWRHKDDDPSRDDAVVRMAGMIDKLVKQAHDDKLRVAPFIAIGCPGIITRDGTIEKGAQNLPGDWEDHDFSLSRELAHQLPLINGHEPLFVIHNDAVVQGLSEAVNMQDVNHWGVFTIGTGLGNARFTNRDR